MGLKIAVSILALVLTACGSNSADNSSPPSSEGQPSPPISGTFNGAPIEISYGVAVSLTPGQSFFNRMNEGSYTFAIVLSDAPVGCSTDFSTYTQTSHRFAFKFASSSVGSAPGGFQYVFVNNGTLNAGQDTASANVTGSILSAGSGLINANLKYTSADPNVAAALQGIIAVQVCP